MAGSPTRELRDFLREYERRTNTHDFTIVRELIHPDAVYWFSDGTHEGRDEIGQAFNRTWDTIQDEVYSIEDVRWLTADDETAACIYTFRWRGVVDGKAESGSGRGTSVLTRNERSWTVIHEHLSAWPVRGRGS